MAKVLVVGSTGMLGSAVERELVARGLETQVASRSSGIRFNAEELEADRLLSEAGLTSGDYVVNCVGLTKSRIDASEISSRSRAIRLNVDFPASLAISAEARNIRVIQVATDCVYSGIDGTYDEVAPHDAHDVYGKTKSLGEVPSDAVMHLRCSLIGPEVGRNSLFFEWVRNQPANSNIHGFINHHWNGLTSKAFGSIVSGLILKDLFAAGVQHLVPRDRVTKDELVRLELAALDRLDVEVTSVEASIGIDRTLETRNHDLNLQLFNAAGYSELPTVGQMLTQMCSDLPN